MKHSRSTADVSRPIWRHGLSLLPLVLGALMIFVLLAGQAQPVSAQYPVLPTPTAAPAPPTQPPVPAPYPVLPTPTAEPAPPTATPVPAAPTATVAAPASTTPPVSQPTVAPAAPTKPATQPTAGAPAAAGNPTATPAAAVSAPQAATATSGGPATATQSEGPLQSALRAMLTGLGTLWLILGLVIFVLALVGIGYLFKNRGGGN